MDSESTKALCIRQMIKQYNLYFQRKLGSIPGIWKNSNEDHHCFIPSSDIIEIINVLHKIWKQLYTSTRLKFLDCGCGIGNIILIARGLGYDAYGIEYEKATCKIARNLTWEFDAPRRQKKNNTIIHGDAATFEHYADYDVIYYYTPIKDLVKRKQFHEKLASEAKVGAIVVGYGSSYYFLNNLRFEKLQNICWAYKKIRE